MVCVCACGVVCGTRVLCFGVVVSCCVCWLVYRVVSVVCGVCGAAWHAEKTSVCRFKTLPSVPAKRAHVFNMRACCRYTRKRFETTHGDVLNLHTERREGRGFLLSLTSLLSFSLPSFSLPCRSLHSFSFSLSSLSLSSSLLNNHSSSRFCLCQSAWTLTHSLFGEHVRFVQKTTVLAQLCKPHETLNEVGLYLCWKWVLCLCFVVLVSVSMCCLRCVVGCLNVGVGALAGVWW